MCVSVFIGKPSSQRAVFRPCSLRPAMVTQALDRGDLGPCLSTRSLPGCTGVQVSGAHSWTGRGRVLASWAGRGGPLLGHNPLTLGTLLDHSPQLSTPLRPWDLSTSPQPSPPSSAIWPAATHPGPVGRIPGPPPQAWGAVGPPTAGDPECRKEKKGPTGGHLRIIRVPSDRD